jgi:hypothetical protein
VSPYDDDDIMDEGEIATGPKKRIFDFDFYDSK